ncbi:MAG: hypothetical protein QOG54_2176 [Actinomycetota bacterium]|nr:hypothetical protein [Actinomycetota bacterium]
MFSRAGRWARSAVITAALSCLFIGSLGQAEASPRRAAGVGHGLELVATVPYQDGTHLAHTTIKGREYFFAANQGAGAQLRVIDVTNPPKPKLVAQINCGYFQGNLQVSSDRKTLILGVDGPTTDGSCIPGQDEGFATIDISNPLRPTPIGFASIPGGSHSTAAHPTEPFVYNAPEGSAVPDRPPIGDLEVWSIANPAKPKLVNTVKMPGVHSPHDISFNKDGSMAAIASISGFQLLDTSDPKNPVIEWNGQCPGCQHAHEARFTADSKTLVVNDESMTGAAYPCPGGALYFYDIAGSPGSRVPELVGTYSPGDIGVTAASTPGFCTAHVFDISPDGTKIALSWHADGIRYLDIKQHTGYTFGTTWSSGPEAVKELGSYTNPSGDYFVAKFHKGPYIYAVDMTEGFEVFKITE